MIKTIIISIISFVLGIAATVSLVKTRDTVLEKNTLLGKKAGLGEIGATASMKRAALTQEQADIFDNYLRTERLIAKEAAVYKQRQLKYKEALSEIHKMKLQNKVNLEILI